MTTALPSCVHHVPQYLDAQHATHLLEWLDEHLDWQRPAVRLFGNVHPIPRTVVWFGQHAYGYSGIVHEAAPMPAEIRALCERLQHTTGQPYNGVLANRYQSGRDSMGWHSDDDYDPGQHPGVASISLGATRRFRMRHRRQRTTVNLPLTHGSLLFMGEHSQTEWQHALPRTQRPVGLRINLTFRYMHRSNCAPTNPR